MGIHKDKSKWSQQITFTFATLPSNFSCSDVLLPPVFALKTWMKSYLSWCRWLPTKNLPRRSMWCDPLAPRYHSPLTRARTRWRHGSLQKVSQNRKSPMSLIKPAKRNTVPLHCWKSNLTKLLKAFERYLFSPGRAISLPSVVIGATENWRGNLVF